jgi:hypothetical protein
MAETMLGLAGHRVALFYECRWAAGEPGQDERFVSPADLAPLAVKPGLLSVTFDQVAGRSADLAWIDPQRLAAENQRSLSGAVIWQAQSLAISHDLHPAIRSILGSVTADGALNGDGAIGATAPGCYRLTDRARTLFAGRYRAGAAQDAKRRDGFVLKLGPSAARRIGAGPDQALHVQLEDVAFLAFRTGIGIAVVEAVIEMPGDHAAATAVLIEATHLLSDERRPPLLSWAESQSKRGAFHISDLLNALLRDAGFDVAGGRRMFSYATAITRGEADRTQIREIAFRLSRHYNYTYAPQLAESGTRIIEPFINVVHAMSLEGAATLVTLPAAEAGDDAAGDAAPEFLSNWIATAYRHVYLPIVIVAYHEQLALLDLAQSTAIDLDFDRLQEKQVAALQRLCQRFLAFRLRYRPAVVSFITMHNEFSDKLRQALGIEVLSQKAAQDAIEADTCVTRFVAERDAAAAAIAAAASEKRRKELKAAETKRERRWAWHGTLVACLLAILAVLNFTEQMSETPASFVQSGFDWSALKPAEQIKLIGLLVAIICGIFGGYINWFRLRHTHSDDELLEEAKSDQAMERRGRGRRNAEPDVKRE